MSQEIDAIYVQGHLIPLQPLKLRERERVRVLVEQHLEESTTSALHDLSGMNFHEALVATGLLGSVEGEPADLSTNPKYMAGFGEHDRDSH